jgi:DNA-binding response OmpR family regulator
MDVLIADDDRVLATALSVHLRKAGVRAGLAFDAMQAFMMAAREPVALIVLDIGMPGGSGWDVLQRLKTNTRTCLIPVLVLTGTAEPQAREKALKLGADGFLAKPKSCEEIVQAVTQLLSATAAKPALVMRTAGGMR